MKFDPRGHRLLIKSVILEQVSKGGIVMETGIKDTEDSEIAEILAIGSQAWKDVGDGTPWAKVGDKIVIKRYAGMKMPKSTEIQRVINDEDLVAVVEDYE